MKLNEIIKLDELAAVIVKFDADITEVLALSNLSHTVNSITWCSAKNSLELHNYHNTNIIIDKNVEKQVLQDDCNYILCDNPRRLFQLLIVNFFMPKNEVGIAKSAKIDPSVIFGINSSIGENVVIEKNCVIGHNVAIDHGTIIKQKTVIGDFVTIGCNCVIGGCGFGYEKNEDGNYELIPHLGNVVLYNNVEIGNATCIDRGVLGSTVLYDNVKVDNLVHIAHGVEVGNNSVIIASTVIGGSTKIGSNAWISPSVAMMNGIKVGDNAVVGLGAVVIKSVESSVVVAGNPAKILSKK